MCNLVCGPTWASLRPHAQPANKPDTASRHMQHITIIPMTLSSHVVSVPESRPMGIIALITGDASPLPQLWRPCNPGWITSLYIWGSTQPSLPLQLRVTCHHTVTCPNACNSLTLLQDLCESRCKFHTLYPPPSCNSLCPTRPQCPLGCPWPWLYALLGTRTHLTMSNNFLFSHSRSPLSQIIYLWVVICSNQYLEDACLFTMPLKLVSVQGCPHSDAEQ